MPPRRTTNLATRRRWLQTAATAFVGGNTSLAGCFGDDQKTLPGEEFPAVDEWLTETEVGGADDTYDGVVIDARETDQVRVEV